MPSFDLILVNSLRETNALNIWIFCMIQRFKIVFAIFIFYQSSCYSNKKYIQYIDSKENHVSSVNKET